MFHTHQDDEPAREKHESPQLNSNADAGGRRDSSASSHNATDAAEQASIQDFAEEHESQHEQEKSQPRRPSLELRRTASKASNILEGVASRVTTRDIPDPGPPPDGGLHAWTQVACGWIVIFATWGYVNSFGAFQTYYTSTLTQSASTISWIGSIQVWLTFFIGAFSGRLLDAGMFLPTFAVGMVLQLLGIFMMSLSTEYWHLMLTQGIITGIGGGIFFTPSMGLIATYFSKNRGLAIGIASTGNSAGGMIYPVLVRELLPKLGFAWTARVLGFLNMAGLAVALAFMRPRLPPRKSGPVVDVSAFKEKTYLLFVGGIFFMMWAIYYTFYYIASFGVESVNLTYADSTLLIVILNGVGFPARILPPFIADKIGPLNVVSPTLLLVAVIQFTWLAVGSEGGFYAFTVAYGIASAAFQCLIPTTVASLTRDLNMVGTRLGMAFSIFSFAALTGPPVGGALQSVDAGLYRAPQIWAGASALVCAGLVGWARFTKVGWSFGERC